MKMETPNEQNARSMSSMLKQVLQDEAYLRALDMMERMENTRYKNGEYGSDEEWNWSLRLGWYKP